MKRLSIAILATALEILSAPPGLMAAEGLSQIDLAAHIMDLGKFDIETSRRDVTLTDCALVGRRLDLFREDEEPPKTDQLNLDDAKILMSLVYIDLRTVNIDVPTSYEPLLKPMAEDIPPIYRLKPASSILYAGDDNDATAILPFTADPANPIVFEEPVHRRRTKIHIKRGRTRPSSRGDGASFVFRDTDKVVFKAEGHEQVGRLVELEKALLEYQDRFCRNLS